MHKMLNKPDPVIATVLKGVGGFYTVLTQNGQALVCRQRGKLRKKDGGIFPGDKVHVTALDEIGEGEVQGMIEEVLPRKNHLLRPKVANISLALVVLAAKTPKPDLLLLDRILVMCLFNKILPIICLNKWDIAQSDDINELNQIISIYNKAGFNILGVSSVTGFGLDKLLPKLQGETAVLAGPSGVGKSSLLNALFPQLELPVGEVSLRLRRGKHTTRHVEMLSLDESTLLADTPGFSLLDLPENLEYTKLPSLYPEFMALPECRFEGCVHDKEPNCRIKEALASGGIDKGRYERYLRLLTELKEREVKY